MRTREEIQKEIDELKYQKHIGEMADDFFYTNGKYAEYRRKLYLLEQELKQVEGKDKNNGKK